MNTTGRRLAIALAVACLAAGVVTLPSLAAVSGTITPTVVTPPDCAAPTPTAGQILITLSAFPANTAVVVRLVRQDGSSEGRYNITDAAGNSQAIFEGLVFDVGFGANTFYVIVDGNGDGVVEFGEPEVGPITVRVDCPTFPTTKAECAEDGFATFGIFKNQGDCVSYVATRGRNEPGQNTP
jgi:hypothetical protein